MTALRIILLSSTILAVLGIVGDRKINDRSIYLGLMGISASLLIAMEVLQV